MQKLPVLRSRDPSKDVSPLILRQIIKDINITVDEFLAKL